MVSLMIVQEVITVLTNNISVADDMAYLVNKYGAEKVDYPQPVG